MLLLYSCEVICGVKGELTCGATGEMIGLAGGRKSAVAWCESREMVGRANFEIQSEDGERLQRGAGIQIG
jgi:hypothetical protein